jgi:hypothetical protein
MKATRRVVTGHDAGGKAIVLADGPAPNVRGRGTAPLALLEDGREKKERHHS